MIIYKWVIPLSGRTIDLPDERECVLVDYQQGMPVVWFAFDPNEPKYARHIAVIGTGMEFHPAWNHLGSVNIREIGMVWHLYEITT